MKKTFTLLATVLLITTASFAQYNDHRPGDNNYAPGNNNYGYNNNNNGGSYNNETAVNNDRNNGQDHHYFGEREKQMRVAQINYEYDKKICSVQNSFFMGRHKKEFKIAELQAQRESEISYVMASFNNRNDHFHRYDDHDRRNW